MPAAGVPDLALIQNLGAVRDRDLTVVRVWNLALVRDLAAARVWDLRVVRVWNLALVRVWNLGLDLALVRGREPRAGPVLA